MRCEVCRGACCESILLPLFANPKQTAEMDEINRWFALHGKVEQRFKGHPHVELEARCTALSPEGRCNIYETRPRPCAVYPPGGEDCLKTVAKRRTPEQYLEIREEGDPPSVLDIAHWDARSGGIEAGSASPS